MELSIFTNGGSPMKKQLTLKEAHARNKRTLIITIIVAAVVVVLGLVTGLVALGLPVGLITLIVGVYAFFKGKQAIKRSFCPHCGTNYNYETDVAWEVSNAEETDSAIYANVDFECHCQNCQEETFFTEKFKTAYYDKNKNCWVENNIRTMAKNYFWN